MISDLHNNFMINTGKAKASDFENLGEIIIDKVQSQFGIKRNCHLSTYLG